MPAQKNRNGIWFHRFMSPKNKFGVKKRLYVQCPVEFNSTPFLKQLEREAIERHMSGMFTTGDTFASYVRERFLKEYPAAKNLQASSVTILTYYLEKLAIPELGSLPLGAIDAGTVARFAATLQAKKGVKVEYLSDRTVRHTVMAIGSVLRWAAKIGDLSARPEIQLPKVAKQRKAAPFNSTEVQALISKARNPRERALFLLVFDAGLRISEALGLTWSQLDFDQHKMVIDRQCYRRVIKQTKSGRAREIPISAELEKALRAIRRPAPFVLVQDNGRGFSATWARNCFIHAEGEAGLRHARVHDGRHHFSTRCVDRGMSPFTLQMLLGHRDIRTTQTYVHPTLPDKLPSVLDG